MGFLDFLRGPDINQGVKKCGETGGAVLLEDFNADNVKIDAALAGKAGAASVQALEQQTAALAAAVPKIVFGTYTGDGAASRVINLGFTPKAVYTVLSSGTMTHIASSRYFYGGLAITGRPVCDLFVTPPLSVVEIVSGGFQVFYKSEVCSNQNNTVYHYIAFA